MRLDLLELPIRRCAWIFVLLVLAALSQAEDPKNQEKSKDDKPATPLRQAAESATINVSALDGREISETRVDAAVVRIELGEAPHTSDDKNEPRGAETNKTVEGRVLDSAGTPIAGAEVWLPLVFGFTPEQERVARGRCDDLGRFRLDVPAGWLKKPYYHNLWTVWAYAPDHQIAIGRAYDALFSMDKKIEPIEIRLGPATDTSFMVMLPGPKPVPDALVSPVHFRGAAGGEYLPRELLRLVSARTDEHGRARLPALSRNGLLNIQVSSDRHGNQLQWLEGKTEPAERAILLRPTGRVEGRIVAENPEWTRGVRLELSTDGGLLPSVVASLEEYERTRKSEPVASRQMPTNGTASTVTDAEGKFAVPAIAAGPLSIDELLDKKLPVRARLPERVNVEAGAVTEVEIRLEPAVRAKGVIRVRGTGQPIAGAEIRVGFGVGRQGEQQISDKDGRFEAGVLPGKVSLFVIYLPGDFTQMDEPRNTQLVVPEGVAEFDLPPIEVVPAKSIRGRLLDTEGRPLMGILINGVVGNRRYGYARSDKDGQFTLSGVPADVELESFETRKDNETRRTRIVEADPLVLEIDDRR